MVNDALTQTAFCGLCPLPKTLKKKFGCVHSGFVWHLWSDQSMFMDPFHSFYGFNLWSVPATIC